MANVDEFKSTVTQQLFSFLTIAKVRWSLNRLFRLRDRDAWKSVEQDALSFVRLAHERLKGKNVAWLHGASIGEVKCLGHTLSMLVSQKQCDAAIISYTSPDGLREAKRLAIAAPIGVITCPILDICERIVKSVLRDSRLQVMVFAEGDTWPRLIRVARQFHAPMMLIDGRFKRTGGWIRRIERRWRYRRINRHCSTVCVGTEVDYAEASRFICEDRLRLTGPSKAIEAQERIAYREELRHTAMEHLRLNGNSPVVVVGSTLRGESDLIADICGRLLKSGTVGSIIIAPRYVRKRREVAAFKRALARQNIAFSALRVDEGTWEIAPCKGGGVVLVEAMGLLPELYSVADVAIIGGSFDGGRGHNILEAIAMKALVVIGPEYENWRGIVDAFVCEDCVVVSEGSDLAGHVLSAINDEQGRRAKSERATQLLAQMAHGARLNGAIVCACDRPADRRKPAN